MRTDEGRRSGAHAAAQIEAMEFALTGWGDEYRRINAERDPLVRGAVARGVSKHRVHVLTGLARTTIDDILSRERTND